MWKKGIYWTRNFLQTKEIMTLFSLTGGLTIPHTAPPYGSKGKGKLNKPKWPLENLCTLLLQIRPFRQISSLQFPHSNHCSYFTTRRCNKRRSLSCLVTTVINNVAFVHGDVIKSMRLVGLPFTPSRTNQSRRACVVTKYTANETHCPIRGRGGFSSAMENVSC